MKILFILSQSFPRHPDTPGQERFPHVIRMREIQDRVTQQHEQLLMLSFEKSRERLFPGLYHNTIAHPLPELCLCCPKLFPVFTDHQCRLLFPLFLCVHFEYTSTVACLAHTETRWGSLSCEAASNFQLRTESTAPRS